MTSLGGTTLGGSGGSTTGTSLGGSTNSLNAANPLSGSNNSISAAGTSSSTAAAKKKQQKKKKNAAASGGDSSASMNSSLSASAADRTCFLPQSQSDDEGILDYKVGGYHPVSKDDVFNSRYQVVSKLGWGHFSTVWLCLDRDTKKNVALKIVRSAKSYTETAEDEIQLLTASAGTRTVAKLLDQFTHRGPHGKHVCMVFEVLGNNLLDVIKHYRYRGIPMPIVKTIMKQVLIGLDHLHTKCNIVHTDLKPENVLLRLPFDTNVEDFTWGQQYGFYKYSNNNNSSSSSSSNSTSSSTSSTSTSSISTNNSSTAESSRLNLSKERKNSRESSPNHRNKQNNGNNKEIVMDEVKDVEVIDLDKEKSTTSTTTTTTTTTTMENRSNKKKKHEVEEDLMDLTDDGDITQSNNKYVNGKTFIVNNNVLGEIFSDTHYPEVQIVDLGNACWIDRHFTDDIQTRQYRSPEAIVRGRWSTPVDIWSAACMAFELATGDHLFKPKSGKSFDKSDDHLALMIELLGNFPKTVTSLGSKSKEYFNHKGELRRITKLSEQWPLYNVLTEKYKFSHQEATEFSDFILPMLRYTPEKRATAKDCLNHPFLQEVPPFNIKI